LNTIKLYNGKIITPQGLIEGGCILISEGKIIEVNERDVEFEDATEIDVKGQYISPGFIDIHVHGGGGHDFMDNTLEAFLGAAELHAQYGTTALMPTTLSCEKADLLETLSLYDVADKQNTKGAQFIGLHIEGPYFAMEQRGAQDPRYIRDPVVEEYTEILAHSKNIKRWSAAPELKGALEFGDHLKSKNILVAIAHTDAIYEEVLAAHERGFTHATHFYSCMSSVSRRDAFRYAGAIEAGYLIDDMTVEIIADGIHLPPPLLKLVYKIKGPDHTALITDAMRAAGLPPGMSILGSKKNGMPVIVEDNVAKLTDRSAFAGSVVTADRLVANMVDLADIPLLDAVKMMTLTPARIMKLDDSKGSLVKGKDADIIVFDRDINIRLTIVNGQVVYSTLLDYEHIIK
jgi:N-acetylglucosamine-6-phosphate deacetylase